MVEIEYNPWGDAPFVAYSIDVGMDEVGKNGTVLSNPTIAWARVMHGVNLHRDDNGNYSVDGAGIEFGHDIRDLAKLLSKDIRESVRSKLRVAIGMNAPMWQPTPNQHSQDRFDLFPQRFARESALWWSLSVIGRQLLERQVCIPSIVALIA